MMSPTPSATAPNSIRHHHDPYHHQDDHPPALNRSVSTVQSQLPGQPTQSRSFRILQMITDTAGSEPGNEDGLADSNGPEMSGRLSRSSVGSNNSGSGGRMIPPGGERRLNLTQDDRELMDMFRSQGTQKPIARWRTQLTGDDEQL